MTHRLNKQQQVFVERYVATGDGKYAAEKAGYASPAPRASQNLANPAVQAEIRRRELARLFQEALPAAVQCLISVMTDAKAPAGARVSASKVVLDRTIGEPDSGDTKEPHEMTSEELAARIKQLEDVAASRATLVDMQPQGGTSSIDDAQSAQEVRNEADIFQ